MKILKRRKQNSVFLAASLLGREFGSKLPRTSLEYMLEDLGIFHSRIKGMQTFCESLTIALRSAGPSV